MVLTTSLGGGDLNEDNAQYKILFWIIWLIINFIGNIVLMNFIIAVVSDSYGECMTKKIALSY